MYRLRKSATLTCPYGPMYLQLDDYPKYSDKISDIFETHINRNLRCIHGYTHCGRHTDSITCVSNSSWDMLLSEFIHAVRILKEVMECDIFQRTKRLIKNVVNYMLNQKKKYCETNYL